MIDSSNQIIVFVIYAIVVWSIPWKAVALWKSARNNHLIWYILFTILNTAAILEILYIFVFSKKKAK